MAELFKIRLTLLEGQKKKNYTLFARSGETLLETIQRELHGKIELREDSKYGHEVARVGSLSKNEKEGVHFWIGKKVPFVWEGNEKLYLSLYHIQVDRNMHLRLELVSASCDFAGSVVNPRLDVRVPATECEFEKLQSFRIESTRNPLWKMPIYPEIQSPSPFQGQSVDYFRYFLLQNLRGLGGWKKKPREPEFAKDFAFHGTQAQGEKAEQISQFSRSLGHLSGPMPFRLPEPQAQIFEAAEVEKAGTNASLQISLEEKNPGDGGFRREQGAVNRSEAGIRPISAGSAKSGKISKQTAVTHPGKPPRQLPTARGKRRAVPLSSLTGVRAVIFDLDGIIVDSEKAHLLTFNQVLKKRGLRIDARTWRNSYTGIGSVKIMEDVFRRNGISENVRHAVAKRAKIYQNHVKKNGLPEIAGFKNFQRFLSENKVGFMVASGGHKPSIAASLKSIGLPQVRFVGLEDVKHGKPSPEIFLLAAKKLGVKPCECVVFEDSLSGMESAARAGMPCIALPTTLPVRILKGRASAIFKDYNSPGLKALMAKLILRKRGPRPGFSATRKRYSKDASHNKRKKMKTRRPSLLRLGRR